NPKANSTAPGDRPAQRAVRIDNAKRRSSPCRDIAQPRNIPPSKKNVVGCANGANAISTALAFVPAVGTAPMNTHSAIDNSPVTAIGTGPGNHQKIVSNNPPPSPCASGIQPPTPNRRQAAVVTGPSTRPTKSSGSPNTCAGGIGSSTGGGG